MTPTELMEILASHKRWLVAPTTGTGADLRYANLTDATIWPGWKIVRK